MLAIKNISVVGKFALILGLFGALSIGSVVYSTGKMHVIDDAYSAAVEHQGTAALEIRQAARAANQAALAIADLVLSTTDDGNRVATDDLKTAREAFVSGLSKVKELVPEQAQSITAAIDRGTAAIDHTCAKTIETAQGTSAEAMAQASKEYLAVCRPVFKPLTEEMKRLGDDALAELNKIDTGLTEVTNGTIMTTYVAVLGGLAIVMALAYFAITAWVSRPLRALASTMNQLASGDMSIDIAGTERKDELGPMAQAVQVFKQNALNLAASEAEQKRLTGLTEEERRQVEAKRTQSAREQVQVVQSLAQGLEHLSNGELVFRLNETFATEYDQLRKDFNSAMQKLQDTMKTVASSTSAIRSGTGEISSASDDLSRRTEQQAASLEETAAALDEITATVRKTAEGSKHARDVVGQTRQAAEHSGQVVRQAVEAMSGIEASSDKIGNIIGVIDEIAFQTNLLALNAGVEAARAGEAGRGFAVVASEVRALAQRSAEAAKEIKTLISASSQQVDLGVDLVAQTGKALERIIAQVKEVNDIVADIAASAQEQASGLDQVNTAVNQMDQVTQQNAAMVEESTAASHALSRETEELSSLVGRFQLGDGYGAPAPTALRRAPAPVKIAKRPVGMLKSVGRGGAARAPAPAADADWAEF